MVHRLELGPQGEGGVEGVGMTRQWKLLLWCEVKASLLSFCHSGVCVAPLRYNWVPLLSLHSSLPLSLALIFWGGLFLGF